MSLSPTQATMVRKLVALATELRGHQRYLVDRRHELLAKQTECQRQLQHAGRQRDAVSSAVAFPIGGDRDVALTPFEQALADGNAVWERVNADIKALDQRIASASRDSGEASRLADRMLAHEGLDEDLQRVARRI